MVKKNLLPNGSNLQDSYYEAKKVIKYLELSYDNIDVCNNNCMLYLKDDKSLEFWKVCGTSKWKENKKAMGKHNVNVVKKYHARLYVILL